PAAGVAGGPGYAAADRTAARLPRPRGSFAGGPRRRGGEPVQRPEPVLHPPRRRPTHRGWRHPHPASGPQPGGDVMTNDTDRKLELRLVPAESPANPQMLDDLIRLVRQGLATAPKDVPQVGDGPGFRPPTEEERKATADLGGRIKHRIEQDPDSHGTQAKWAELTS